MNTFTYRSLCLVLALFVLGFQPSVGQVGVELPQITEDAGEDIMIPVTVNDTLDGENVTSYQFTLPYDSSVLSIADTVETKGTLTPGSADIQVASEQGEIRVSVASQSSLSGSGTLIKLPATLVGAGTIPLSFSNFQLFDQDGNEVATTLVEGKIVSEAVSVSLPEMTADVGATVQLPIEVDTLDGRDVTSYQFTLPYDASVLTISGVETSGTLTPSSADVQVATEQGEIRVSVAAQEPLTGVGTLLKLNATLEATGTASLSFSDFALFDSDGNEVATSLQDGQIISQGLIVSLPEMSRDAGSSVSLPVNVEDLSGEDVTSYQFTLPYDASILTISGVSTEGTLTPSSADVQVSTDQGQIKVSVAAQQPLSGSGTLIHLETQLVGGGTAPLSFSNFQLFDSDGNEVATTLRDGEIVSQPLTVTLPQKTGEVGDTLQIPIEVDTLDGKDVTSYQFTLPYDASILTISGVETSGTLTPSSADVQVATEQGEIRVSVAAQEPLTGVGTLIKLTASLEDAGTAPLSFSDLGLFNSNGNELVTEAVEGKIVSQGVLVSLPTRSADIGETVPIPISVDTLDGKNVTSYQFTLPYDASVLSIADTVTTKGTLTPSSADIQVATEQGEIRVSVATQEALTGSGTLLELHAQAEGKGEADLNFSNFDLFNVDGNNVAVTLEGGMFTTTGLDVRLPKDTTTIAAGSITLPIRVEDVSEFNVTSYQFTLPYDASILTISGVNTEGTLTPSSANVQVATEQGEIRVSVAAQEPFSGSGVLLKLETTLESTGTAPLSFSAVQLFDQDGNEVATSPQDGHLVVRENAPPHFTSVPSDATAQVNETLTLQIEASDPDGDEITYSLLQNPENSSIDSGTGEFTFTPSFQQRNSDFLVEVEASDGKVAVDTSFSVTVQEFTRSSISVNINQSFGDATKQSNYQLVGLPGKVDLPIAQTLAGTPGKNNDWRAFWDDGSSSTQAGLMEFDGSSQFNFQPGRGFWVLSRKTWSVSQSFNPVPLDNNGNATISLHSGWNIISNPLGKNVSWSAVQSANGFSKPLWSWNGSFSQASSFASAKDGSAYYFLNDQNLDELKIPFFEGAGASQTEKSSDEKPAVLKLTTLKKDTPTSSVWLGLRSEAKQGKDKYDHFAPPSYFEDAVLRVSNDDIQSKYSLASDIRPMNGEGQTYTLSLSTKPGTDITISASGLQRFAPGQRITLFHSSRSRSYDLRSTSSIEVTPESKTSKFVVMIGSESFVQSKQSELVPKKVKLHQNYPNPFRDQTTLRYAIPEEMNVRLEVYDLLGRRIKTLVDGRQSAGVHTLQWDGQSSSGRLASGTYLVRLQAGDQTRTMKMVLVK